MLAQILFFQKNSNFIKEQNLELTQHSERQSYRITNSVRRLF